MRSNHPVTQREYPFPRGKSLISVTDLKGRIVYCNSAFIETSAFTREELLGQPHNLVRHPDMPAEAFRDLWDTIQAGLPWSGIVKNRRKTGDHYWVHANATPMMDGDRMVGFLSVRTEPTREAVAACERLYATMQEEAERGHLLHVLHRGKVHRTDGLGRIQRALQLSNVGALVPAQLAFGAAVVAAGAFGGVIAGSVVALVGGALVAQLSQRAALKTVSTVVADARRLASGDLTVDVSAGADGIVGELQQALRQLAVNMQGVVRDTRSEVDRVERASREIASSADDLARRTEAQASSLEQTAASMEEIHGTVKGSASLAIDGARVAKETADAAQRSHAAVQAVVETMSGIADSSRRIDEIVVVIEDVAFQTNILALNASVEAARAGSAGRGFAVVASEVRSLAGRTALAAREIKQLIVESAERVTGGAVRTQEAHDRMEEVLAAVERVRHMLQSINVAANEQQNGIAQINQAVSHMDTLTQQNAAMVEELAASSIDLSSQVESVSNSMRLFRLQQGDVTVAEQDAVAMRRAMRSAVGGGGRSASALETAPGVRRAAPSPANEPDWAEL